MSEHEEWRDVPGHEHYQVNRAGSVRSWRMTGYGTRLRDAPVMLRPFAARGGYLYYKLSDASRVKRHRLAHTVVLDAFVGQCPPGMQCRHLNGNPADNRVDNLAWGTAKENGQDRVRHGTQAAGIKHGSVTKPEMVPRGARHGSVTRPGRVARGDRHGSKTKPESVVAGSRQPQAKLSEGSARVIKMLLSENVASHVAIAKAFGVSTSTVWQIRAGKKWRHV